MTPRRGAALICAVALALAGCGGGTSKHPVAAGDSPTGSAGQGPSNSPGTASTGAAPATPTTRDVGKSIYFGGFELTVNTLRYTPPPAQTATPSLQPSTGTVTLDVTFANDGTTPQRWNANETATLDLANGDHHWQETGDDTPPTVPGQAKSAGTFTFDVDTNFDPATAVLTVGTADFVQSVLPLGSTGQSVDNAGQPLTLDSTCTSGPITLHVTGGHLRADLPRVFTQADKGKRYLLLNIDASNHASKPTPYGDEVVGTSTAYALKEPSGNSVTLYDNADYYGDAPVATVRPGDTKHTMQVYTIDAPTSGQYQLIYTYTADTGTASAPGTCSFTLP